MDGEGKVFTITCKIIWKIILKGLIGLWAYTLMG